MDEKININVLSDEINDLVKSNVKKGFLKIKNNVNDIAIKRKERFALLIELYSKGQLSEDSFKSRLEDEKLMLEAELLTIKVISKSVIEEIVNKVLDLVYTLAKAAV